SRVLFAETQGAPVLPPRGLPVIGGTYGKAESDWLYVWPEARIGAHVIDTFAGYSQYFQSDADKAANDLTIASIVQAIGPLPTIRSDEMLGDNGWLELGRHSAAFFQQVYIDGTLERPEPRIVRHQMLGAAAAVQNAADIAREGGHALLLQ